MSGAQNGLPEDMNDMSLEEFIGELEQNEEIAEGKRHTGDDFYRMYLEEMKEIAPFAEGEQERLLALLSTGSPDEAKRAAKRLTEGKLGDTLRIARNMRTGDCTSTILSRKPTSGFCLRHPLTWTGILTG